MQADLLAGHCVERYNWCDIDTQCDTWWPCDQISSTQDSALSPSHHHATQHPRQLKLSFFLSRWRIFYFQLCLVTMSVVSETATQISFLDRSLQLLQLPPWNLLFPQRRTFVPQIAKSPRKISSHPKKHFNRQLAGYFYWRKDPHRRVFLPIFKSLKSA